MARGGTVSVRSTAEPTAELRRSVGLRTAAAAAGLLSTFLLTVVGVRVLDPGDAAVLLSVLAALSIGPLLGRLGLGPNLIRLLPTEPDPTRRRDIAGAHLRATGLLSVLSAPVVAVVATVGSAGRGDTYVPVLLLTAALIVLESLRLTLSDVFAALGRVHWSVATTHHVRSTVALPLVGAMVLVSARPTLVGLLAVYAAVAAAQLGVALAVAHRDVALLGLRARPMLVAVIGSGTLLFTLDLAAFLVGQGTVWLASAVFAPLAAAQYSTAAVLAMQVTVLESLAALAVTPAAARLWAADRRDDVVRMLSAVATLATVVTAAVVVLLWVAGGPALRFAYGPDMAGAHLLLAVLAAAGVAKTAFGVNITVLIISGHIRRAAGTALGVLSVAIPAAVLAAVLAGPVGLAIVSATATVTLGLAQWIAARAVVPHPPRADWRLAQAWRALAVPGGPVVVP